MEIKAARQNDLRRRGQSIIETVVGILFLIPIVLFLLDIAVLVMANTANDNLAKSVARAAASARDLSSNVGTSQAGWTAAQAAANTFPESGIINKPGGGSFVTGYCWNGMGTADKQGSWPSDTPEPNVGNVAVVTAMVVKLPVPFPFLPEQVDFQAKAVEPIVALAAGAELAVNQEGAAAAAYDPNAYKSKAVGTGNSASYNDNSGMVSSEGGADAGFGF